MTATNPKNWYELHTNLKRIFELESNGDIKAFPNGWKELKKWFEYIDEDMSIAELMALIKRIDIDDLICKNNAKEFLLKKIKFPKGEFEKIICPPCKKPNFLCLATQIPIAKEFDDEACFRFDI